MEDRELGGKYYTPDISEFFVGLEYEAHTWDGESFSWCEDIFDQHTFDSEIHTSDGGERPFTLYDVSRSVVRVKYLDIKDIEELGFKHIYTDHRPVHLGGSPYAWGFIRNIPTNNEYSILYNFDTNILKLQAAYVKGVLFNGFIKNKSELKKLLTQLGIEYNK
jgi:hypothetical protein